MKIDHANFTSVSKGVVAVKEFGINFDATLAYSLMSGIAKDKIAYPVREVGTNAYDANPSVPFDVQLPTWLDPTFRVRDYGPGLSYDDVMSIYTTFGGSGKRHTNEMVGGLGYGSKSPFAYLISRTSGAASFSILSYFKGEKHIYVMALSESGMPTVRYMGATKSKAPSGIEVSFAVSKSDVDRFTQAARSIYWHFPVKPNGLEFDDDKILESGKNWKLYGAEAPISCPHVRMGCVAYPIDLARLGQPDWPWRHNEIVFDAPIGSLSFTTSREDLGYDDATIAQINSLLKEFEVDYAPKVQAEIDKAANYFEACHIYNGLLKTHPGTQHLNNNGLILFKGQHLRDKFVGSRDEFTVMVGSHYDMVKYEADGFIGYRDRTWSLDTYNFRHVKSIIYTTNRDRLMARIKELQPPTPFMMVRGSIDLAMQQLGIVGEFEPTDLATVKLPRRPKGAPKPKVRKTHYFTSGYTGLEHELIDRTQGGIFVYQLSAHTEGWRRKRTYRNFDTGRSSIESRTLAEEINTLRSAGLFPVGTRLWVFRGDDMPETPNWEKFGDYVARMVGPKVDLTTLGDKAGSGYDRNWDRWVLSMPKLDQSLVPQDILDFTNELVAFKDLREKVADETSLINLYLKYRPAPDDQQQETKKERLERLESELYGKYPLLKTLVGSWAYYSGANEDDVVEAHHYFYLLKNQK